MLEPLLEFKFPKSENHILKCPKFQPEISDKLDRGLLFYNYHPYPIFLSLMQSYFDQPKILPQINFILPNPCIGD